MAEQTHPQGRPPALANLRFAEHAEALRGRPLDQIFDYIYQTNLWGSAESHSGVGSEDAATAHLRRAVPALLASLGARTLLDLPCGDFGWLSRAALDLDAYIGADIVAELVERNAARYGGADARRSFVRLDITRDALPRADVVLCRDCLVHLSDAHIFAAFANLRRSDSRYLLTTTFTGLDANRDVADGDWRPLNLQLAPFHLPPPLALIVEGCTEEGGAYADKSLGLWEIAALER